MQHFAEVFPAGNIRHVFVGQDVPGKGMYAEGVADTGWVRFGEPRASV